MKSLKNLFTVLLLSVSFFGFSQKVTVKKGIASIDGVETYKIEEEGKLNTLSTMGGNEFITILEDYYDNWVDGAKYRPRAFTIKFLENGQTVMTDLSEKDIIKAIFKSGMVSADGKIDSEKMNLFVNKYNDENLKYKLAK